MGNVGRVTWVSWVMRFAAIIGVLFVVVGTITIGEKTLWAKELTLGEAGAMTLAGMALVLCYFVVEVMTELGGLIGVIVVEIKEIRHKLESARGGEAGLV